jgi:hypothetical protein
MRDKLPTKGWHVVVTKENNDILAEWKGLKGKHNLLGNIVGCDYWNKNPKSKGHNPVGSLKGDCYDFGEEISFEEFKVLVLGEQPTKPTYEIY